jgi:hypothetical protein
LVNLQRSSRKENLFLIQIEVIQKNSYDFLKQYFAFKCFVNVALQAGILVCKILPRFINYFAQVDSERLDMCNDSNKTGIPISLIVELMDFVDSHAFGIYKYNLK